MKMENSPHLEKRQNGEKYLLPHHSFFHGWTCIIFILHFFLGLYFLAKHVLENILQNINKMGVCKALLLPIIFSLVVFLHIDQKQH